MSIQNTNNPFDYIGFYHNQILDDVANVIDTETFENPMSFNLWLQSFIVNRSVAYLSPDMLEHNNTCLRIRIENAAVGAAVQGNSIYVTEGFNQLMNLSGLPTAAKNYFIDMYEEIRDFDIETPTELDDAIAAIIAKEANISSDLGDYGRYAVDMAYMFLSVARYSCFYWHNNFTDSSSKWYDMTIEFDAVDNWNLPVPQPRHWSEYVADDAAGALLTVITTGGLAGPWGCLAGAVSSTGYSILSNNI